VVALASCNSREDAAWQRIREQGVLRVGLDPTYPPFETADDGALRGIDVDLARALGNELGLDVEFVYFGYDGLYDALATEQADVLISALVIRVEQTGDFAYSEPYFNAGQILIVPGEENGLSQMTDLDGQTLSVELGAQGHVVATEWENRLPNLSVEPYNTPEAALDAVVSGQADAVLIDAVSGRLFLANEPTLKIVGEPVTVEPYAMVVRKENERLLDELNGALAQIEESGQLADIINRWMARGDP
jgi:polar amino acid transport system substrate-binding protein